MKIDAGVPATANIRLEVGSLAETVEVSGGADVLQTQSATVTSTLVGRQLHELPFTSRNLTELIVTQPGSATPGVPRSTSVYGLPQSALNVTLDGINIQDNSNKSSDGFFNAIFPRADSIEEMTVTAAAAGADSNAEGAMQVKMVTRSGSNTWHGGLFEQHRNQSLNANSYFNNLNGTAPRDHLVFNQFGGLVGGPIKQNKLFFFTHVEVFQLPQTYTEPTGQVLTPDAINGIFRYRDTAGAVRSVNLYQLAAANGFPSTPDPLLLQSFQTLASLTNGAAGLKSRIATNADYNRNNLDFQSKGGNYRRFPTTRLDYNVTEKHHLEFVWNYQTNIRRPDGVNVGTASPIAPGTGNVLNGTEYGNQGGIAFSAVAALRSTITPRLVSEIRFGLVGGTVVFNNGINPGDFDQWRGYAPTFGTTAANYVTNPYRTTGQTTPQHAAPAGQRQPHLLHVRALAQFRRQLHPAQHLDHLRSTARRSSPPSRSARPPATPSSPARPTCSPPPISPAPTPPTCRPMRRRCTPCSPAAFRPSIAAWCRMKRVNSTEPSNPSFATTSAKSASTSRIPGDCTRA